MSRVLCRRSPAPLASETSALTSWSYCLVHISTIFCIAGTPQANSASLLGGLRTRQFWDVQPLSSHTGDGMSVFFFTILLSVFISYYFLRKSSCFTHPKPYFLFFGHFLVRVRNNLFITSTQRTHLSLRSCLCSCNRRTSGGFCRTASIVPWSSVLKRVQSARELSGLPKRVPAVRSE